MKTTRQYFSWEMPPNTSEKSHITTRETILCNETHLSWSRLLGPKSGRKAFWMISGLEARRSFRGVSQRTKAFSSLIFGTWRKLSEIEEKKEDNKRRKTKFRAGLSKSLTTTVRKILNFSKISWFHERSHNCSNM